MVSENVLKEVNSNIAHQSRHLYYLYRRLYAIIECKPQGYAFFVMAIIITCFFLIMHFHPVMQNLPPITIPETGLYLLLTLQLRATGL